MCISNPFSAEQSGDVAVDSQRYKQNIHSGDGDTAACMGREGGGGGGRREGGREKKRGRKGAKEREGEREREGGRGEG